MTTPDEPVDPFRALVAVMDRLRSPGGCPWDAEQTHASLVPYLLEEVHELAEAVDEGDRAGLREELGDVLLQVVFHARIAAEDAADPFDVDDVARDLVAKLVHRHPHVFAGADTPAERLHAQWDAIKKAEKHRDSALDGVPGALPALARAQKVAARAGRAGLDVPAALAAATGGAGFGDRLLALALEAHDEGVDAEGELRRATARLEQVLRSLEG
ncbi:MazG family protein [Cellulomonas sp. 73-92]|uniref:MazG family protein n=1 Tax=Cellulomonas sp. 73-92 TaxID=1895740 RepID=UPI000B01EBBE|nr:MazG family protein [Cellulomonas sp. 73-92]